MKRSKFDETRDQRIADEVGVSSALMCAAHGCPNLWSTSDGHLCRWHIEAPAHRWPEVTREMHDHITDQALSFCNDKPGYQLMSREEKGAILARLRAWVAGPKDPRAWICDLEDKEHDGERLSPMQKLALEQVRRQSAHNPEVTA